MKAKTRKIREFDNTLFGRVKGILINHSSMLEGTLDERMSSHGTKHPNPGAYQPYGGCTSRVQILKALYGQTLSNGGGDNRAGNLSTERKAKPYFPENGAVALLKTAHTKKYFRKSETEIKYGIYVFLDRINNRYARWNYPHNGDGELPIMLEEKLAEKISKIERNEGKVRLISLNEFYTGFRGGAFFASEFTKGRGEDMIISKSLYDDEEMHIDSDEFFEFISRPLNTANDYFNHLNDPRMEVLFNMASLIGDSIKSMAQNSPHIREDPLEYKGFKILCVDRIVSELKGRRHLNIHDDQEFVQKVRELQKKHEHLWFKHYKG